MDHAFWHQRWENGQIGFHEAQPNAMLRAHLGALELAPGSRLFLPLCGKTRDIGWLLAQGLRVAGAELSETAVKALFADLGMTPEIGVQGAMTLYSAPGLDLFVGDIFDLTPDMLGPVDAIYDRAALVALPEGMRQDYAAHMTRLAGGAPHLLITFEYDQSAMSGPPFSVTGDMVQDLYGATYNVTALEGAEVPGGFKGRVPARETAWHLTAR
ncbi:thiopurine S-methyltransferase [Aestuariicoccus sp. MJ-SS9]|uniref:thiopurine S-methyltransferase n=1 Tax=Aestuariicoccus sp. MJ-SS9 TaxID=3079855 RepID=UPI002911A0E9|nr:thiopurine S-methyltransferase [Aestuariicoccus sp. MJ-SS9]MDU8910012.1 thiopurine S-methyltransferase [Aestuariicoccus sp. MJ-SS9]